MPCRILFYDVLHVKIGLERRHVSTNVKLGELFSSLTAVRSPIQRSRTSLIQAWSWSYLGKTKALPYFDVWKILTPCWIGCFSALFEGERVIISASSAMTKALVYSLASLSRKLSCFFTRPNGEGIGFGSTLPLSKVLSLSKYLKGFNNVCLLGFLQQVFDHSKCLFGEARILLSSDKSENWPALLLTCHFFSNLPFSFF